jgi:tRNA 5-methylaminomethyl-2-thiouridine biosynthesis bifunctional protein
LLPWFAPPEPLAGRDRHIAIIGAGLAGCASAVALAKRGFSCQLIDRFGCIAGGTSAVPQAVIKPHVSRTASVPSTYFQRAFDFIQSELNRLRGDFFNPLGVLQLVEDHASWPPSAGAVDQGTASRCAGVETRAGALHFAAGGSVSPADLCRAWMAETSLIKKILNAPVDKLRYERGQWQLLDHTDKLISCADAVIIASGVALNQFTQAAALPLQFSLGQISSFQSGKALPLHTIITGRGLAIPEHDQIWLGATHERCDANSPIATSDEARRTNLSRLDSLCRLDSSRWQPGTDWAGLRASTADRLPLVGALPDTAYFLHEYRELRHGRRAAQYPLARYHAGLYVLGGLGSRGATQAAYAGELLARLIAGESASSDDQAILDAVHPGRFFIRALRRGQPIPEPARANPN